MFARRVGSWLSGNAIAAKTSAVIALASQCASDANAARSSAATLAIVQVLSPVRKYAHAMPVRTRASRGTRFDIVGVLRTGGAARGRRRQGRRRGDSLRKRYDGQGFRPYAAVW